MGYTKQTWTSGTAITSALLNHMETQYDEAKDDVDNHNHDSRYYTKSEMDSNFWHAGNDGSGSGCDADTVGGYEAADFAGTGVPSGLIIWWYGSIGSIQSGWNLCDGNNGTVDLRGKFPVGAGSSYAVGATGGYASRSPSGTVDIASHTLTVDEIPAHSHQYYDSYSYDIMADNGWTGTAFSRGTSPEDHARWTEYTGGGAGHDHPDTTLTLDSQENRPPYMALAYIQKS